VANAPQSIQANAEIVAETVVVGSGPSGVSAAWPLVESGRDVLMIDAGADTELRPRKERPPLHQIRDGVPEAASYLLGSDLEAIRERGSGSPKLRTAAPENMSAQYQSANNLSVSGFELVGAALRGGLSNIWGAGVSCYDDADLGNGPLRASDLEPSYKAVSRRVGVSGVANDDMSQGHGIMDLQEPLPLSPPASKMLQRYTNLRRRPTTSLGHARLAVLSQEKDGRGACDLNNGCMWGCSQGAIYSSGFDLTRLRKRGMRYHDDTVVERIVPSDGGFVVYCRLGESGAGLVVSARRIVVAAGPFASTRLVLAAQERFGERVRIHSSPSAAAACLSPSLLGAALPKRALGMSQLSFSAPIPRASAELGPAVGSLFCADAVSAADLLSAFPTTVVGSGAFIRYALPALQLGLFYLPGEYSDNYVQLTRGENGQAALLQVTGGYKDDASATLRRVGCRLAYDFARLGVVMLPGSLQISGPGAEVHYGASLPIGRETSFFGEVNRMPGLYVADGSVLPRVSAKHHTMTVMANADRIGRHLVEQQV